MRAAALNSDRNVLICFTASFFLVLYLFWPAISPLTSYWKSDEYSHSPLVVILAVVIALHRLSEKKPAPHPSRLGWPVLVIAGIMLVIGSLSTFNSASMYGFILALLGLVLSFIGTGSLPALVPALIYLAFAVPLPQIVYTALSAQFQLISSSLGVDILDALGTTVYQEGNIIDLGTMKLQVVEACSGLRYLFPLMSFGFLTALLMKDRLWKRIVLFLSSIPITIAMNSARIALVGFTSDHWGSAMAEGFLHDFEGWTIFVGCFACMMGEASILLRVGPRGRFRFDYFSRPRMPLLSGRLTWSRPALGALLLCAFGAAVLSGGVLSQRAEVQAIRTRLESFPLDVDSWKGTQKEVDAEVLNALQVSDHWLAEYRSTGGDGLVELYVGYYASQRFGSSSHSPSNCIPGGGWQIVDSSDRLLPVAWNGTAGDMRVTRIVISKGGKSELVYYWFDERGRNLTGIMSVKWHLFLDSLTLRRTDGALIRLVTPIVGDQGEAAADARLVKFLGTVQPILQPYLPPPPETEKHS
ncbi:MAG TPA: VPLPA-CTERM-specific exosortase XrtD [Candidatus Sulfotelmatobacter sp.]|jgi:exosortase D (VPLPA-CTERM-specific)|nr:VPLPA-CTERM-specific exosortase XrtD [Candidatus Sulfotelmatobacter sp.]